MYRYYQEQAVLPTYARFKTPDDLVAHEGRRKALFVDKLCLPPQVFQGARLVEFGPDAGENALVFARWGASLTLVEPNPNSWARIQEYFEQFRLQDRLLALEKVDLEHFETDERFRIIDAEGFIYTIKPESVWIRRFSRLVEKDGFVILFYYEKFGALLELMLKAIHARCKALLAIDGEEAAWKLFEAKWNSVPHTRSFQSWVMDVLENPYVRLPYFFEAGRLCAQLQESGFALYSSWPHYRNSLRVDWHKTAVEPAQRLAQDARFIARSRLSFALGRSLWLCAPEAVVAQVTRALEQALEAVDRLIDGLEPRALDDLAAGVDVLEQVLATGGVVADSPDDASVARQLLQGFRTMAQLLADGDADGLITFCKTDPAFLTSWGVPGHFAVFRNTGVPHR